MPRNQKFLILVVLFVLLSVSFASGALEVSDVTLSPTILWLHKNPDLTISAKCALDGVILPNATVKADIYPPSSNVPLTSPSLAYDQNSERYKKTFQASFSATGTYTVKVTCSYQAGSATAQENFIGNKLELRIINDIGNPADAYMGGKLSLHVELLRNNALVSPSQDTFEVWVGKEKLSVISLPIIDGKYQKIEVKIPLDPAELTVGVYDLKVNAKYEGSNVESALDDVIRVNTPLTMDVTDEKVKCPAGLACSESVNAKVVFHDGDIGDFTADKNFQALLKDGKKWITVYVSDVQCNAVSESCIIDLDIPSIDPGEYMLYLRVASPSISSATYESQDSLPLDVIIPFTGKMLDAGGNTVLVGMTFIDEDTGRISSVETGGDGGYSLELLPGVYTVELRFERGDIIKFYNVSIDSRNIAELPGSFIRYDTGHLNAGKPSGLRLIRTVVFEFDLSYRSAWAYVPYDSSVVVGDESNLQVYTCQNWNFKRADCTGEWKSVEREVHTIRDALEFRIGKNIAAAYVIGEGKSLHFNRLSMDKDSVNLGGELFLSGRILDNDGESVGGATITATFEEVNISSTGLTGNDGSFEVRLVAPNSDGTFNLLVRAERGETYEGDSASKIVTVKRSASIGILGVPDMMTADVGSPLDVNLILFNSGQKNLTKPLYVHASGISSEWYQIVPEKFNSLGIGEQKDIILKFQITEKMCGGKCEEFNLVNVEVNSEEVSQAISFTLKVVNIDNTSSGGSAEETGEGGEDIISGLLTSITSSVIENQTNLVIIVLLGIFILVTVMKRRSKGGRRDRGGGLMALNPGKRGIGGLGGGGLLGGGGNRSYSSGQLYDIRRRI